jgi:ABC-type polysaccharide/polyol phosphate export permease
MEALARTVVSFFDLAEAEGRVLRRHVLGLTLSCGLAVVASVLMLAGLAFLGVAAFSAAWAAVGLPLASLIAAAVWLGLAFAVLAVVRKRVGV